MTKKVIFSLLFTLSFTNIITCKDWLDDLSGIMSDTNIIPIAKAVNIMESKIKEAEDYIKKLESKIVKQEKDGLWQSISRSGHKIELASINSKKKYYLKILNFLNDLSENKKDREKFSSQLKLLYNINQELIQLNKEYDTCLTTTEKISINAKILAKQAEISGRKAFIKSSFLF